MKPNIKLWVLIVALAPVYYFYFKSGDVRSSFEVTVRREIENNLASVDPRFVAIVTMVFVVLCVVDMLLAFLQLCNISLLG